MSADPRDGLTCGYLPLAAFDHMEPTSVGVLDLERPIAPESPAEQGWTPAQRDGLLLVRLHAQPLGVLYIDRSLARASEAELAGAIWRSLAEHICKHAEQYGCMEVPSGAQALIGGLAATVKCSAAWPARTDMSVAVIVCTAGREEQLERCIHSLLAQRRGDLEVVVVDNRPTAGHTLRTIEAIADPRVRYVAESRVGLSVARNRGVYETDADLVAFTDDDVLADPGWLEWLTSPFAEPGVTVACGMVLPIELETESQKRFEYYGGYSKGFERRVYDLELGPASGRLLYPFINGTIGVGNSMAFRREELIALGGFDPALGAGSPAGACEETRAFGQAILRGGKIVYEPRALCWHEHRRDGDALRTQVFGYGTGLGAVLAKALVSDPRFYPVAARSLLIAAQTQWRNRVLPRANGVGGPAAPASAELLRARREGVVRGPLQYARGRLRARRERLGDVIHAG